MEFKNGNTVVVNTTGCEGLEYGKPYKIRSSSLRSLLLWSDKLGNPVWIDKLFVISLEDSRKNKLRNILYNG